MSAPTTGTGTRPQVSPGPEAEELAAALAGMLVRLVGDDRAAELGADRRAACWAALADGDWIRLGEPLDGGRLSLVDLAHVAETWGAHVLPVPYLTTVLARRRADTPPDAGPLTFAISTANGVSVPFADWPGIRVAPDDTPVGDGPVDDFAATYPVGHVDDAAVHVDAELVDEARVLGLAEAVGVASAALGDAVGHARERTQFTVPIGSFQAVAHRLADMHRDVEIGRSLVLCAAHAADPATARAALDEGFTRARHVVEGAIQVHGGMGFTWEIRLHHLLRHVMALRELLVPARPWATT